ncbi:LOW QUALITY PROTEIN: protein kintoun [Dromiciops gliroides]|uniref:LOW QUALITY PROTEIN: protein kintoun n=1 Tax=Dromiciops gliroides TaxID=33562 RepID=UPI001CC82A47|nr:LOW QUALITY PROTEIN: protein kintoun [Dromiciops gliroides]
MTTATRPYHTPLRGYQPPVSLVTHLTRPLRRTAGQAGPQRARRRREDSSPSPIRNMASENPASLLQDLDLSAEEVKKLTNAFEDPEFRRLFGEYAAELSDPENRRRYEEEITALERERGVDVQFVHPEPGHVLRTSLNGAQRCFVNICSNPLLGQPSSRPGTGGPQGSSRGQFWSLPYSLAPGREYMGRQGARYKVYDVIFHPNTLSLGKLHDRFRSMIDSTALEAVEKQFGVKLDRRNAKTLKIKYKGTPEAAVLRTPLPGGPPPAPEGEESGDNPLPAFPYPCPYPDSAKQPPAPKPQGSTPPREEPPQLAPTVPRHSLVQRHHVDLQDYRCSRDSCPSTVPRELVVTIELPLLRSTGQAVLEVTEKQLLLDSRKPDYRLRLPLPYPVDESRGSAQFNKAKRQLVVTLPVVPPKHSIEHLGPQEQGKEKTEEEGKEEKKGEEEGEKKEEEEKKEEGTGLISTSENTLLKQGGVKELPLASKGMPETDDSRSVVYSSEELGSQSDKLLRDTRNQEIPLDALIPFQSQPENSWALAGEESIDPKEGTTQDPAIGMAVIPPDTKGPPLVIKENPRCYTGGEDFPSGTVALPGAANEMPPSGTLSLSGNAGPPGTSGQPLNSKADLSNGTGGKEPAVPAGSNEVPPFGTLSFLGNTGSAEDPKEKTTIGNESFPGNTNKVQPRETDVISETHRVKPLCPPLQCNQDEESLTLLIQVPQVQPQSLLSDLSPHQYKLCFSTQDFVSYSFVLQFAPENKLSTTEPKINVSSFNTAIELAKSPESYGHWRKWYFGLSNNCLQERFFVIEENVDEFLEDILNFKKSAPKTQPLIEVLEVSDKKTQIQLKSQEVDGQDQFNEKEQRINIRSHLTEKENQLPEKGNIFQTNTKNNNNTTDVEKEHTKRDTKPSDSDSYTADKALEKSICGSAPCMQPPGTSTEVIRKPQQSDSVSKPVFTKEITAVYSSNEKQNVKEPALMEKKELHEDHIHQSIKETNMKDGSVQIIEEHVTDCAFTFQNSLLYDLD